MPSDTPTDLPDLQAAARASLQHDMEYGDRATRQAAAKILLSMVDKDSTKASELQEAQDIYAEIRRLFEESV